MPIVIFSVKTDADSTLLYHRGADGDPVAIGLVYGVGRRELPADSDQAVILSVRGRLNRTADIRIEQETVTGRRLLAERLDIVVNDKSGISVEIPFKVAEEGSD